LNFSDLLRHPLEPLLPRRSNRHKELGLVIGFDQFTLSSLEFKHLKEIGDPKEAKDQFGFIDMEIPISMDV